MDSKIVILVLLVTYSVYVQADPQVRKVEANALPI